MTDVKPMWRVEALTDYFGPCGIGWKYEITNMRTVECTNGEVPLFVDVLLYVKHDGAWSDPIPGCGGSKLVANESKGPYVNDEAYKMATTDALSTAMKYLGVAADIYAGLWDGSKYITPDAADTEKSYMEVVMENIETVATIKQAIALDEYSAAAEAWYELDDEIKKRLWKAPTKGGCFTTKEREIMKTTEFREAHYGATA